MSITYNDDGSVNSAEYKAVYEAWRQDMIAKLQDYLEKGEESQYVDIGKAMTGIKFRTEGESKTFGDILNMDATSLANMSDDFKTAYTAFLDGMVKASMSDNYDLDSVYDSVKDVLANAGIDDLTIDMGDTTFHIGGGMITQIDWSNQEAVDSFKDALNTWEE